MLSLQPERPSCPDLVAHFLMGALETKETNWALTCLEPLVKSLQPIKLQITQEDCGWGGEDAQKLRDVVSAPQKFPI